MASNPMPVSVSSGKPAATIYDIARMTGFSPSTVSRALHKPGRVGPATEKKVREAADALGYRINPMARFVTTGRTGTIALVLSDITNPVFFDLVRGAERMAAQQGQTLVVAETLSSSEVEKETVERLLPTVDGLVLASSRLEQELVRQFSSYKKVVLVNRNVEGVPSVVPLLLPGIRAAVDHLAGLGHKKLAYLAGPSALWMSRQRLKLLEAESARAGLSIVATTPSEPTLESGRRALGEVFATGASAVVAYNDLMAIGLLLECREANKDIPRELSIVGFDDIFGSGFTSPSLTTIRTPLSLAGEEAVRLLVQSDEDAPGATRDALVTEFVPRRSTGPAIRDLGQL